MPQLPPGLRNNVLSLRYLLLGFLLSWLPLPASGLAAIPLALSLFYGIRYLRDVRRAGVAGAFGPNLVGLVLTALLLAMTAAPVSLGTPLTTAVRPETAMSAPIRISSGTCM